MYGRGVKDGIKACKMKNTTNNTITSLITVIALTLSLSTSAKTYTIVSVGKWSDASIWENGTPGHTIAAGDQVIVKNHIAMNEDVTVNGTLTIDKGMTVTSTKALIVHEGGNVENNGNLTVRKIYNEGTIRNTSMIEAMNEIDNKGNLVNNGNMVAGTNLMNNGQVGGTHGAYFANSNVISTGSKSKFSSDVKIYSNPDQISTSNYTMNLAAEVIKGNVMLTVTNPNNETARNFTIEKSTDGKNFQTVNTITANNSNIAMIYQDKNVNEEVVSYRIKVNNTDYLPQATVRMSLASASIR
jgi:hypothetical protein